MKFTFALALVAAATVVSAESNAARLARGLPPNAPVRRGTQTDRARRGTPSGSPSQCDTGPVYCCNTMGSSEDDYFSGLISDLGIDSVSPGTLCGSGCSPLSIIGVGSGTSCEQQPVCCSNNTFNGIINVGCSPVNINL